MGFSHWHQPLSILTPPLGACHIHECDQGLPVDINVIVAAVATALLSVNGYDSGVNFAEEVPGSAARVGRTIVIAALLGVGFVIIPFVAIVFSTPDLVDFLKSDTPISAPLLGRAGPTPPFFSSTFVDLIIDGAQIAVFNASIAITQQFARIVWASGRDVAWPEPVSTWIAKVVPGRGTPWVATLVVGALAAILCFKSVNSLGLVAVVTFTSVLILILYALIAISAIVSRMQQAGLARPWRMPLWPLPPIVALAGVVLALTQQKPSDLMAAATILGVGAIYYFAFIRPRAGRYWRVTNTAVPRLKDFD